jgi:hypothetical protein
MTERRLWILAGLTGALGVVLWLTLALRPATSAPPTVTLGYVTGVDTTEVTTDESGWMVTSDVGIEVMVDRYVVRTWSAVVSACASDTDDDLALTDLLTVDEASASHSEAPDPAGATGPVEQDLAAAPDAVALGDGVITADALCGAHVAVAGGEGTGDGRTEPTIEVSGTYRVPGAADAVPFSVTSVLAWGGVVELDEVPLVDGAARVLVVRDLSGLFDGVDFDAADEEVATALLQALAAATSVEVTPST